VLESLARVLQLDADERAHLFILAHGQSPADPLPLTQTIDPALQLILDTMGIYPALVLSPRWDMIAWNQAASRMIADFSVLTSRERNLLWFLFTDSRHHAMAMDWEREAVSFLALFRASTQRYVGEPWLIELINNLKQVSPAFREWWPRHDIQGVQTDHKYLIHPLLGLLVLQAKTFQVADHPDLQMVVYTPVSGTDTAAKLALLSRSAQPSNYS
jgi:transcription regulator MmyB-like protein